MKSTLIFFMGTVLCSQLIAQVRITFLDKNDKPIVGATVYSTVDGSSRELSGDNSGFPEFNESNQVFDGVNFITNSQGQIISDPQDDFQEEYGGFFSSKTSKNVEYSIGLYSFGKSSLSTTGIEFEGYRAFNCKILSGQHVASAIWDRVSVPYNLNSKVDVICKTNYLSKNEVLMRLDQFLKNAKANRYKSPMKK